MTRPTLDDLRREEGLCAHEEALGACRACAAAARIAVLEDAIRYGCDMIVGGFPMEAALEMDRRLADPEFDMFREQTT